VEMMNGPMMQALLEDRFKLKMRREIREVPVYDLTVAKGGPKLKPFDGSCTPFKTFPPPPLAPGQPAICTPMELRLKGPALGTAVVEMHLRSVEYLSEILARVLGRLVIDKTGIAGNFDFYLEFAVDQSTAGIVAAPGAPRPGPDDPPGGPSIFTEVQNQLGLKLEPARGPRQFLVVESVERPSEN
jgi:uncharacterized protein (TIGR03435 family)